MSDVLSQIKSGFGWSLIENLSLQGVRFFTGIIMARLLSPTDYGMVAMLTVFIVISDLLINGGVASALNVMQDRQERDFSTAFLFNLTIGIFLYVVLFFMSGAIASFYGIVELESLTKVLASTLIIKSLCVVPMAKLQIELRFRPISIISVVSAVVGGLSGIYMAMNGYGVYTLVYCTIIGSATRLIVLYAFVRWIPRTGLAYTSLKGMLSYGSKLILGQLIDVIYSNVYPFVIGKVYSAATLGYYSRAQGYSNLPSSAITMMIYRVCFPAFCKQSNDKAEFIASYFLLMRFVAFCVIFVMTMLMSLAKPLIIVLVTDKWIECVNLLKVLCFATIWYPILEVNLSAVKALGYSSVILKTQVISKIFAVFILVYTLHFDILVLCIGFAVVSLISLIVNFSLSKKIIGITLLGQMRPLIAPLAGGVAMYASVSLIMCLTDDYYLQCVAGMLVGSIAYFAVAYLLGFPVKTMLANVLRKNKTNGA